MGLFGWSYPPGCSGPPDDDYPCLICGGSGDSCICPECPVCESYGDPECYEKHGLIRTKAQIEQREALEKADREAAEAENNAFELMQIEQAAHGMVSGTSIEWPFLLAALRKRGVEICDTAQADEIREVCLKVLSHERT